MHSAYLKGHFQDFFHGVFFFFITCHPFSLSVRRLLLGSLRVVCLFVQMSKLSLLCPSLSFSLAFSCCLSLSFLCLCHVFLLSCVFYFVYIKNNAQKQWQTALVLVLVPFLVAISIATPIAASHFFVFIKPTIVFLAAFSIDRTNRNKAQPG